MASSHRTMSEIARGWFTAHSNSAGFASPAANATRMWVSRLSIPPSAGRKDVALYGDFPFHRPNQLRVVDGVNGQQPGNGMSPFCDNNTFRFDNIQNLEAFRLEFCRAYPLLHGFHIHHFSIRPVR